MDKINQAHRILRLLASQKWTPLPEILDLRIASHTRRIHELRKAGHVIERKEEREKRSRRVWYRLVRP